MVFPGNGRFHSRLVDLYIGDQRMIRMIQNDSFLRLPQQRVAIIVLSSVAWPVTSELAHELAAIFMPH
ncbi:hypothetical protein L5D93_21950 [Paenibacillus thiaminolyticus]|nr:hypothetical protein [Paenibacillus thiaminolyticus]